MRLASTSGLSLLLAILTVCSGCSLDVYTNIQKRHPARVENSPVLVYESTDSIPLAETLGSVSVKTTGFSTGCNYAGVLQTAKENTNKVGGNGLYIAWHKKPTRLGRTCHQISADILLLPDSLFVGAYPENLQLQRTRIDMYDTQSGAALIKDKATRNSSVKHNGFSISAGYSLITSQFDIPMNYLEGNVKQGLGISAGYQWVSRKGFGMGVRYSGHFASLDKRHYFKPYDREKVTLSIHYIAPEFVLCQKLGPRWTLHEAVGVGYTLYCESLRNLSTNFGAFGCHAEAGFNYRIKPWLGIGASVMVQHARFKKDTEWIYKRTGKGNTNITRMAVNGGLRFYFF